MRKVIHTKAPTVLRETVVLSYLQTKRIVEIPGNKSQVRLLIYAPYSKELCLDKVVDIPEGGIDALWIDEKGYYPLIWQRTTEDLRREVLSRPPSNNPRPKIYK